MEPPPEPSPQRRTWTRRLRVLLGLLGITLVVALGACAWSWSRLRASLPTLSGRVVVRGPSAPIRIDRDALGVPTVRAASWGDLVFGLGFLHSQERFFEMEVQRRAAAGELAELFGPGGGDKVVDLDRAMRRHQFRERARQVVAALEPPTALARGLHLGRQRGARGARCGAVRVPAPRRSARALGPRGHGARHAPDVPGPPGTDLGQGVEPGGGLRRPAPAPGRVPRGPGHRRVGCADRGRADRRAARPRPRGGRPPARGRRRPRRRHAPGPDRRREPRQQQLGGRRRAHQGRRGPRGQRHAPEARRARRLVSRLPDLAR